MSAIIQFIQWIHGGAIRIHPGDDGAEAEHVQGVLEIGNGYGNQVQRRIKARYIVALIIFVLVTSSIVIYVSIGGYTLDESYADLKAAQVQRTAVEFYRNDSTRSFEAKLLLRVGFSVPREIKVHPKPGTFVLSVRLNESETLHAYCESEYIISNDIMEPLFLNFTTHIQEEELRILEGKFQDLSTFWIKVRGDLKMDVKLKRFPLLPKAHRHTYFLCDVPFTPSYPNKTNIKDCMTSREPIDQ